MVQSSQLLTLRDEPINRELALDNVSSIPNLPHFGNLPLSFPTSNRAANALVFKTNLVTPSSATQVLSKHSSSGLQPVVMRSTR